jgi:autotransporter-associated beta strand protein
MRYAAFALVVVGLVGQQTTAPKPFDPVGKYSFSTTSDAGAAVTGTLEITGAPGSYKGSTTISDGTVLAITDVMTSPNGLMAISELPNGGVALVRLVRDSSGKFTGAWGQIAQSFNITATKAGGH